MDSLPQWDALSEGARDQLLRGVVAMLHGDAQALTRLGDNTPWDELCRAGIVQTGGDAAVLILTGLGTCLVLDALQASGDIIALAA